MILSLIYPTIVIVLLLTFSFGPAFFALINTGITHGTRTGSLLALGVVLSDFLVCMLVIFLVHFGATNFIQDEKSRRFLGILAGIVLIVFGALHFKERAPNNAETVDLHLPSTTYTLMKGFLLNSLNPAVWLLWLGHVTAMSEILNYKIFNMILYFSLVLGLVLSVEILKVSAASKLKKILTTKIMYVINNITGVLLIVFGLALIYNHYFVKP